ncbi:PepSY-associated TM helix domain-containing protein [Shewanella colwelliana]|uniref:PepSY-associated TM helix domain-containing protein n=1 Tax=Shewanella colwelliana TaxID=23 RepID=UPI0022AF6CC3|nr:PepSY-associated TM helix domain-containing protein [Shewanella colwelliana]MCZ4336828.1 PepSY-associated TM helix domain-containing protein [Shewanella colwelliana]
MRKRLFKWHSYSALIAMLPLMLISITGSILVFKVELDSWLRPEHMQVNVASHAPRMTLDTLMHATLNANSEFELGGWELFDDKQRSDAAYLIQRGTDDWYKVYINQYSAELLSAPEPMGHYLTDWLLELHYSFLWHVKGATIGFVSALIMLFLGGSGVILYRKFWRKLFTLRLHAAKRVLFSDLHKFVGIVSSPVLIIVSFTGAYWNIAGILHEIDEHGDGEHYLISAPLYRPDISFEALRQQASLEIDSFQAGYLAMPHEPDRDITFYGQVQSSNPLHSEYASVVSFDKTNGLMIQKQDIRDAGWLTVFLDSFRKLHFGYFGGLLTRILWCLLGLMPLLLALTGGYLYWFRRRQSRRTIHSLRRPLLFR